MVKNKKAFQNQTHPKPKGKIPQQKLKLHITCTSGAKKYLLCHNSLLGRSIQEEKQSTVAFAKKYRLEF